jgi:tetratricopeptide (TPR) repeat protein
MVEGEILRGASRFDEAVRVYNTGLAEMPDDLNLLYGRAMIEEKLDQIDLMEKDLRKIIEREPNNAEALNALGYTLADRTDRYQEALGYIERALKLKPDSRFVIDSMGWVQYRLGNNKEALDYLRRALDMNQDPEVAAHLIEVLWATGDKDGARDVYRRALQAAPDKAVIENVMRRLEKAEK